MLEQAMRVLHSFLIHEKSFFTARNNINRKQSAHEKRTLHYENN